ncbi:MAG: flagellar hook-associated protein FlgK [Vicinamibacterales bacterium]
MSLFGSLTSASRALEAQQYGLDVTGQNIANLSTEGYSRRTARLASIGAADSLSAGGGVEIQGLYATRDSMVGRRLLQEMPEEARERALAQALTLVESALGASGDSLDGQLTAYFDSFAKLAEDPQSATARQEVVLTGQKLASGFHDLASRLQASARDANLRVKAGVDDVNAAISRIAALNRGIAAAGANPAQVETLKDQQSVEVQKLAGLVDVEVLERPDGGVDVSFAGGTALVIGNTSYAVSAVATGLSGNYDIQAGGVSVSARITSGSLGGFLYARDTAIPAYLSDLDQMAYTLVQEVNTLHDAGFDSSGVDAPVFFNALGAVAGSASAITVNAAVVANPGLVAAGGAVGSPGDNQQARALANLRDAKVLAAGTTTLSDAWGNLLYRVGSDTQAATFEQATRAEIVRQVQNLRDSVSGVSLDEEAMLMIKFQRAYEANARFFSAVDESIRILLSLKQ